MTIQSCHQSLSSGISTLVTNISTHESNTKTYSLVDLENLIIALKQSVETWASQGRKPIDQYEPGSISQESSTQNLTLAITPVDDLRQQYSKQLDDAWASEEYYAFTLPRERETKGIWQVIGGVVLVGVGVACIVATGGAAAPVVIGGAAMLFGYSEVIEGGQNAYYGSAGDMESKEFNPLRDTLFQGDQKVYDYAKNAVAFAASCMIPLGLAYSAGKLTLQSGLFIIGTEAASEGAGFLVNMAGEKMKLDPTLTMILGMAASIGTSALFCKFDKVFSITKNLPKGDITPPTSASRIGDIDGVPASTGIDVPGSAVDDAVDGIGKHAGTSYTVNIRKISSQSADEVNDALKKLGYTEPPYRPGTIVDTIELTEKSEFVRVFDEVNSPQQGGWIMKAEDIEGLTPEQIQNKFALKTTPKYVVDVVLEEGVTLRTGEANSLFGFEGGGTQFDMMGQYIGEFTNPRPLQ